jgi:hypothetical protein
MAAGNNLMGLSEDLNRILLAEKQRGFLVPKDRLVPPCTEHPQRSPIPNILTRAHTLTGLTAHSNATSC